MDLTLSRTDYLQVNRSAGALLGGLVAAVRRPGGAAIPPGPGPRGVLAAPGGLDCPVTPPGADHTSHIPGNHHNPIELTRSS